MKDKIFIDTNIFVYAVLNDNNENGKRKIAIDLIQSESNIVVNTQILNEFYNVLLRHKITDSKIITYIEEIIKNVIVSNQDIKTLKKAWNIRQKYMFSLWDSLVVASALQNNCTILYTEDMQHNQIIENTLKIVNPFK